MRRRTCKRTAKFEGVVKAKTFQSHGEILRRESERASEGRGVDPHLPPLHRRGPTSRLAPGNRAPFTAGSKLPLPRRERRPTSTRSATGRHRLTDVFRDASGRRSAPPLHPAVLRDDGRRKMKCPAGFIAMGGGTVPRGASSTHNSDRGARDATWELPRRVCKSFISGRWGF